MVPEWYPKMNHQFHLFSSISNFFFTFSQNLSIYSQKVRLINCWFDELLEPKSRGCNEVDTLRVMSSNEIQKESEDLSLRYDELGGGKPM